MVQPIWQRFSLEHRHLHPFPEALVSDYLDYLAISMDNPASHQKCTKAKMESYLGTCYAQNNITTMCDIPFHTAPSNLLYCQSGGFADVTHSAADTKHGSYIDKERYKTLRKWIRVGKGKDTFLFQIVKFEKDMQRDIHIVYLLIVGRT